MMREGEIFSGARLPPGAWSVIRLDGRAFTKFTAGRFVKPYDADFRDAMVEAAAHFDARVWQGADARDAVAYFRWRQEDAARCALNAWCHWAELPTEGKDRVERRKLLLETHGLVTATRRALTRDFDLPTHERYGALLAGLFEPVGAEVAHAS